MTPSTYEKVVNGAVWNLIDSPVSRRIQELASRIGFGPMIVYFNYDELATRCFQPLSHLLNFLVAGCGV